MADGLVALWQSGQKSGMIKGVTITTLVFSAAIGGYVLIKNAIKDREMKRVLEDVEFSAAGHPTEVPMTSSIEQVPPTEVNDGEG